MFELMDGHAETAVIKVMGIGGGGGNAVGHMLTSGIEGVDFICANTDAQALKGARVKTGFRSAAISPKVSAPARIRTSVGKRRWRIATGLHEVVSRRRHAVHHGWTRWRHGYRRGAGRRAARERARHSDRRSRYETVLDGRRQAHADRRPGNRGARSLCRLADHDSE